MWHNSGHITRRQIEDPVDACSPTGMMRRRSKTPTPPSSTNVNVGTGSFAIAAASSVNGAVLDALRADDPTARAVAQRGHAPAVYQETTRRLRAYPVRRMKTHVWLAVALLQGAAVAFAGWTMWKRGERNIVVAIVLLGIGLLILVANVLWLVTGGPSGTSPIGMRGGMFGFWLSNVAAVEVLALALLAFRPPSRPAS